MKTLFIFLVICSSVCVYAQANHNDVSEDDEQFLPINKLLEKYGSEGLKAPADTIARVSADNFPSLNHSVLLDHYHQSLKGDSVVNRLSDQTTLRVKSTVGFLGQGFSMGGFLYLNNGVIDRGRSGLSLTFARDQLLQEVKNKSLVELPDERKRYLSRLSLINPRVAAALESITFDKCLQIMNSSAYKATCQQIISATDSLKERATNSLNEAELSLQEERRQLENFTSKYRGLLASVNTYQGKIRQEARGIIDSSLAIVNQVGEDEIRRSLFKSKETPLFKKMLLLSKGFTFGNTRLDSDEVTSAGLPIRGGSFAYDQGAINFAVQHGKRIRSDRFLPNQGIAYHERLGSMRLTRLTLGFLRENNSRYQLISTLASELPERNKTGGPQFLRSNRVFGIASNTSVNKHIALIGDAHFATTLQHGNTSSQNDYADKTTDRLSLRMGAEFQFRGGLIQTGVFYRGQRFESFANPYLIADFKGGFARLKLALFDNVVRGNFEFLYGNGTQLLTQGNTRAQARGYIQASITPKVTASLMMSPNVYRYEISNQQGLSENSIYRAEVTYRTRINERPFNASVSLTNLDLGWTWNDSTTVNKSALLRTTLSVPAGSNFLLTADTQRSVLQPENSEWYHALAITYTKKIHLQFGLRYDKYRHESRGAPAGTLEVSLPLAKKFNLNANCYFRLQSGPDNYISPAAFQSHQSLEGRF